MEAIPSMLYINGRAPITGFVSCAEGGLGILVSVPSAA